jgi:hypothetical protein
MLSIGNLRKHHKYQLTNYGEKTEFMVLEVISDDNYLIQSLDSLDKNELKNLITYGLSSNYQLYEIEE